VTGKKTMKEASLRQAPETRPAGPAAAISYVLVRTLTDTVAVALSYESAGYLVERIWGIEPSKVLPSLYPFYAIPFCVLALYLCAREFGPQLNRPETELAGATVGSLVAFSALAALNFVFFKDKPTSRYLFVAWLLLNVVTLGLGRLILRWAHNVHGLWKERVLFVGSPSELAAYRWRLEIQRYRGTRLVDTFESMHVDQAGGGDQEGLLRGVRQATPDVVVMTVSNEAGLQSLMTVLEGLRESAVAIDIVLPHPIPSTIVARTETYGGAIRLCAGRSTQRWQRFSKRLVDISGGFVGSLIALAVTPLVAAMIKLNDRGPVFYKSPYLARDGTVKTYLKFRTMRANADEILRQNSDLAAQFKEKQKLEQDPRVTAVGRRLRKYSIDEVPQFFSVLKGNLSLVGPRTIRKEEADRYGTRLRKLLSVKAGMTGFWQTNGRQTTSYEERVQMDMFYIDNWSIWLDLVIIARTLKKVIQGEGAY
jgi:exopolysaccharide biosynthesis polyprenyl glycosylphosphotransferase